MSRAIIKAFSPTGFDGRFRAGRKWPGAGLEVELIDAEEDGPDLYEGPDGNKVTVPQIGTKSLAALRADGSFSISGDVTGGAGEVARLTAENGALRARVAELELAGGAVTKTVRLTADDMASGAATVAGGSGAKDGADDKTGKTPKK